MKSIVSLYLQFTFLLVVCKAHWCVCETRQKHI